MSATYVIVTNATTNQLSLVGDAGSVRVDIGSTAGANTANINISDLLGNVLLCSTLSDWVTDGYVTITRGGVAVTAAMLDAWEQGADMNRSGYDSDDDSIVDAAEAVSDGTTTLTVAQILGNSAATQTSIDDGDSPYTALATDSVILCDSALGAITVVLPTAVSIEGKKFVIVDNTGSSETNAITVDGAGAELIDGAASIDIAINYGVLSVISDGVGWFSDNIPEATTDADGLLSHAKWDEIVANTAKVTNVSTALSAGTVTTTTYGITSDGGADDIVLPEATTAAAGLLSAAKWDEIVANTLKDTNVSTALSAGTVTTTTYGITSDGGADDIVLPEATTAAAGLLGAAKWDEIVANTSATAANAAAAVQVASETFGHADLTAGAGTETLTFAVALPATAIVLGAYLNVTEAFNNAGVTATTTCDVGLAGADEFLDAAAMGAIAVVGTPVGTAPMSPHFGGVSITVKVDSNVNVDTLTTGAMAVNVIYIAAADAL